MRDEIIMQHKLGASNTPKYIAISWMNNWKYGKHIQACKSRGQMTLPRMFELCHAQPPELREKEKSDLRIAQHFCVDVDYPSMEEAQLNTGE